MGDQSWATGWYGCCYHVYSIHFKCLRKSLKVWYTQKRNENKYFTRLHKTLTNAYSLIQTILHKRSDPVYLNTVSSKVLACGFRVVWADTVLRTLEHQLKDSYGGDAVQIQTLRLRHEHVLRWTRIWVTTENSSVEMRTRLTLWFSWSSESVEMRLKSLRHSEWFASCSWTSTTVPIKSTVLKRPCNKAARQGCDYVSAHLWQRMTDHGECWTFIMTPNVTLQAVLRAEGLLTAIARTEKRLLSWNRKRDHKRRTGQVLSSI